MLLIAIPKSASTSLMETLATVHQIPCDMHKRWNGPKSAEFPAFHMQHAFGRELNPETAEEFVSKRVLYKSHIVPSLNNQALLETRSKVILLRQTDGIIGAYKRGEDTGVYRQKTRHFDDCDTLEDWLCRAKEIGLYQDLAAFRARWLKHQGDKLVVHYEDLVTNPQAEIERIERYFGLPNSGVKDLLKRKYTRLGSDSLEYHLSTRDSWKSLGS